MSGENKSPIKDKPLRLPGQSLVEERDKLFEDQFSTPVLMAVFMIVIAALELARLHWDMQPSPVIFSIDQGGGVPDIGLLNPRASFSTNIQHILEGSSYVNYSSSIMNYRV